MKSNTLLVETLPELVTELDDLLRRDDENDIADQLGTLVIVDLCRCGDDFCATFYTAPKPRGAWGDGHETIALDPAEGYLNVDLLNRKVVSIEVLYRDTIRDKLIEAVP